MGVTNLASAHRQVVGVVGVDQFQCRIGIRTLDVIHFFIVVGRWRDVIGFDIRQHATRNIATRNIASQRNNTECVLHIII